VICPSAQRPQFSLYPELVRTMDAGVGAALCVVAISADGSVAALGDDSWHLCFWDLDSGEPLRVYHRQSSSICLRQMASMQ